MSDTLEDYYNSHNGRLPTKPIPEEPTLQMKVIEALDSLIDGGHISELEKREYLETTFDFEKTANYVENDLIASVICIINSGRGYDE